MHTSLTTALHLFARAPYISGGPNQAMCVSVSAHGRWRWQKLMYPTEPGQVLTDSPPKKHFAGFQESDLRKTLNLPQDGHLFVAANSIDAATIHIEPKLKRRESPPSPTHRFTTVLVAASMRVRGTPKIDAHRLMLIAVRGRCH